MRNNVKVYSNPDVGSLEVANHIASIIRDKQQKGEQAILGLATGRTPVDVYKELVNMHKNEGLSFKNVVTFNLDEYFPIHAEHELSYSTFMKINLFDHVDILPENTHIPQGNLSFSEIESFCNEYEQKIHQFGGLDFQLLGIGRTGHIGFNEPGSTTNCKTRLVTLNEITREDAINDFNGLANVPTQAITMGVHTIMKAKEIMLLAWTDRKAEIIKKVIDGEVNAEIPGTFLQNHPNVTFVLDHGSSSAL